MKELKPTTRVSPGVWKLTWARIGRTRLVEMEVGGGRNIPVRCKAPNSTRYLNSLANSGSVVPIELTFFVVIHGIPYRVLEVPVVEES